MFDHHIGLLNDNDISLVITADHGMKAKTNFDGEPNAIFLEDLLNKKFPQENFKVILPITDPYVVHHGSLGSFAMIYVENQELIPHVLEEIKKIPEIEEVLNKQDACKTYHLPEDRSGDIVCMSSESFTIGSSKSKHDLSSLKEPLRSHGGLHEREVPFIINSSKSDIAKQLQIYNYDAFYYATHMANK
jgi:phosphonoacetate hydrolase